ncbi:MAG: MGMT family protein [Candidatus Chisholmbacteria bacterium]|nr:MGMT family protein [Candidatus Chisholmbacteria bacterium]
MQNNFFAQVYELVKQIPKGKVVTYGQIARFLGTRDARKIGWALHGNTDKDNPCHRVVNKQGRVALNYAFDGWQEQKRRLTEEGVSFVDEAHVDLKRHLWQPSVGKELSIELL